MNSEQETINLRREENELNLSDLFHIVLANWYWFVLSVLVCAGVAVLYLKWAPKVYTRTASVLIKDNSKGGGLSESAAFEELNMFNVKSNVDNEVLVFKSKRLMSVVAERLNLDISYTIKDGLRTEELYTQSPIAVRFPEAEASQSFSLVATPLSAGEILLSGFSTNEAKSLKVALNDTVSTPVGKLVVTPTLYYADKYFGKAVTISKRNREEIALTYSNSLQVALASKTATIINLTLQDGTDVWLNSGAEIEYPSLFAGDVRQVRLSGEALFDVSRDARRPFIVETFACRVEVLGTWFNVNADQKDHRFSAALMRGSVRVTSLDDPQQQVILKPNEKVSLNDGRLSLQPSDDPNEYLWAEGLISISDCTFEDILRRFERCYGVHFDVRLDPVPHIEAMGKIRITDGIKHAMSILQRNCSFNYMYDPETNTIIIY